MPTSTTPKTEDSKPLDQATAPEVAPESKPKRAPRTVSLFYRPELENPPMAEECTVGFSFINGSGEADNITLKQGLNRKIPAELWERAQELAYAQRLLSMGALRVMTPEAIREMEVQSEAEESETTSIADLSAKDAIESIDRTFDEAMLRHWVTREQRTPVRAALRRRISAIENGEV
jgi:hypothetical protein